MKEPPRPIDYLGPQPPSRPWTPVQIAALVVACLLVVLLLLTCGLGVFLNVGEEF